MKEEMCRAAVMRKTDWYEPDADTIMGVATVPAIPITMLQLLVRPNIMPELCGSMMSCEKLRERKYRFDTVALTKNPTRSYAKSARTASRSDEEVVMRK